ncbi:LysR family transcriptional regulator [Croceicoccus ponticola]|uniref:LysR family transcriptional regulator n=2 Tax=Croceicoccus ponticola TaxID=2217664 RepID=A0A437GZL8_9SPHN|nr:LysR family transcriptional regulator [Croceicoccus ponticola]RVQ68783.1 LysR family transcriptional regulator [Croceicoccus ponticola]
MFDPKWLTSFVTVATTKNFTAAADRLGIGQPAISEHIRKLEARCGRRLFIRDTHSVRMTSEGEAMLSFAQVILDANAKAMHHFAGEKIHGRVRLGVSEDIVLRGLPQVLRSFTTAHPMVELELTVGLSEVLRQQLDAGDLDLIFLKRRVGEDFGELVWREPLVWLAAPSLRLAPDSPVPLVVLFPPSLTRSAALTSLGRHGRSWRIVCTSGSQSGVHAAAIAGLGVAPHAQSLAPSSLVPLPAGQLPDLGDIEFALLAKKGAPSNSMRALARVMKSSGHELRKAIEVDFPAI